MTMRRWMRENCCIRIRVEEIPEYCCCFWLRAWWPLLALSFKWDCPNIFRMNNLVRQRLTPQKRINQDLEQMIRYRGIRNIFKLGIYRVITCHRISKVCWVGILSIQKKIPQTNSMSHTQRTHTTSMRMKKNLPMLKSTWDSTTGLSESRDYLQKITQIAPSYQMKTVW